MPPWHCSHIWSAVFTFKTAAHIVALVAGYAHGVTEENFIACIGLFAMESVNSEVVWIVKIATIPCINGSMTPYLLGNGGWILAEISMYGRLIFTFPRLISIMEKQYRIKK